MPHSTYPGTEPFQRFLEVMEGLAASQRRPVARVEAQADPKMPGRTAYRITGHTRATVQVEIDRLMRAAEDAPNGGFANFVGPHRSACGYTALGEVIVRP